MNEAELIEANKPVAKGVFERVMKGVAQHILKITDERYGNLRARLNVMESMDHRLERHSQHLARLETRLQSLERK